MHKDGQFWFVCFILFTGKQYAAGNPVMGYEYIQEADAWLRLHSVPATWHDARLRCQLEGGILASPTTEALSKAMIEMMTAAPYRSWCQHGVFTGINDLASKGDYVSMEGIPLINITFQWVGYARSQKDCLLLTGNGELTDESCSSEQPYFCRKENARMTVNKCDTTDHGYKWEPRTGSCYKFHRLGKTWHRAQMTCLAEGGHLAIINSDIESQVLKDIFENYPVSTIVTNDDVFADSAMVGFWKWNDEDGDWLTLRGEPLAEAGFENWDDGQPNNAEGSQYCGAISRSGRLNDVHCNRKKIPFICEISPIHKYELYFDQGI